MNCFVLQTVAALPYAILVSTTLIQQYSWNQELEDEEKRKKNRYSPSGKQSFIMQKSVALMHSEMKDLMS